VLDSNLRLDDSRVLLRIADRFSTMERAARLIKNKNVSRELLSDEQLLRAIWPSAVGKAISAHTQTAQIVRGTLIVEVEDAIWQRQLNSLSRQIMARVQKLLGSSRITDVEFRIAIPRRQPARVESRQSDTSASPDGCPDEADGIHDAVLKKVYQLSRKKATA